MLRYLTFQNRLPENELIILSSQTRLSLENRNHITSILSQDLDWELIQGIAFRNGVLPLFSWNLLREFDSLLSSEIRTELSAYLENHTRQNLHYTQKLIEAFKILEEYNIPILPFKGTTLAKRAFDNLALRQYVDLDILVKPKDFNKTVKVLLENGYKLLGATDGLRPRSLFPNRTKDIGLIGPAGIPLELHWKLSGSHFALPFEIDQLWNRSETIVLGGTELHSLSVYDLFVYLCLHGSRHRWEKFSWICDLNELILTRRDLGEELNWDQIHDLAKNHGCEKVVELGLFLTNYFYGLEVDYPDYTSIIEDETLLKIAQKILEKSFTREVSSDAIGDWYLYHLTLKERFTDRIRLHIYYLFWYVKLTFKPNALDEQVFNLPAVFYPLYYILRPFRLFFTYFAGKEGTENDQR